MFSIGNVAIPFGPSGVSLWCCLEGDVRVPAFLCLAVRLRVSVITKKKKITAGEREGWVKWVEFSGESKSRGA